MIDRTLGYLQDRIRWLGPGWSIERTAGELRRQADAWVCRTHRLDWKRAGKERIGHSETGMVISLLRHRQEMKYDGKVVELNLRILSVTPIDPTTMKVSEMNWPAAAELANFVFGDDCPWVWASETREAGQLPRWQWCCFYDDSWNPMAAPSTSLVGNSTYWSMHEHNKGVMETKAING